MYNEIIRDRLNNLTYLGSLKNSNVSAITKKNPFHDTVKFFAQINKNNVIQGISFKASGCSYFVALCSYFCEIVEDKTIDDALKIKEKDLIKFAELDESKYHIYPIILNTFALLVKKYRKGLEAGTIKPCTIEKTTSKVVSTKTKITKSVDAKEGLGEILVNGSTRKSSGSSTTKTTITTEITPPSMSISSSKVSSIETSATTAKTRKKTVDSVERKLDSEEVKLETKEKKSRAKSDKTTERKLLKEEKKSQKEKSSKTAKAEKIGKKLEENPSNKLSKSEVKETKSVTTNTTTSATNEEKSSSKLSKAEVKKNKIEEKKSAKAEKSSKSSKKDSAPVIVVEDESREKKSSVELAIIRDDIHNEEEISISNAVPTTETVTQVEPTHHVVIERVESKRRVETVKTGSHTTTNDSSENSALRVKMDNGSENKQSASVSHLNSMLSKLGSSNMKVREIEGVEKKESKSTVNGKVVDSQSSTRSFSSMRDNLHNLRVHNESNSLPGPKEKTAKSKAMVDKTEKTEKKTKAPVKETEIKEDTSKKKGIFGWLFKK